MIPDGQDRRPLTRPTAGSKQDASGLDPFIFAETCAEVARLPQERESYSTPSCWRAITTGHFVLAGRRHLQGQGVFHHAVQRSAIRPTLLHGKKPRPSTKSKFLKVRILKLESSKTQPSNASDFHVAMSTFTSRFPAAQRRPLSHVFRSLSSAAATSSSRAIATMVADALLGQRSLNRLCARCGRMGRDYKGGPSIYSCLQAAC